MQQNTQREMYDGVSAQQLASQGVWRCIALQEI